MVQFRLKQERNLAKLELFRWKALGLDYRLGIQQSDIQNATEVFVLKNLFIFLTTTFWWNGLIFWTIRRVFELVEKKKKGDEVGDREIILPVTVSACGLGTAVLLVGYTSIDPQLFVTALFVPPAIFALVLMKKAGRQNRN